MDTSMFSNLLYLILTSICMTNITFRTSDIYTMKIIKFQYDAFLYFFKASLKEKLPRTKSTNMVSGILYCSRIFATKSYLKYVYTYACMHEYSAIT